MSDAEPFAIDKFPILGQTRAAIEPGQAMLRSNIQRPGRTTAVAMPDRLTIAALIRRQINCNRCLN